MSTIDKEGFKGANMSILATLLKDDKERLFVPKKETASFLNGVFNMASGKTEEQAASLKNITQKFGASLENTCKHYLEDKVSIVLKRKDNDRCDIMVTPNKPPSMNN